ncbi:MAG: 4-hydroxy-2-oxovalerate aldolase [Verrucomicrobiales bacterium]|nr:4-hydroxy-2-oxovalerate aldolase [Verrucomicrobiales bacterium]
MRNSKVIAKWREGKTAKMATMGLFNPAMIAQAAEQGYDAIWLDNEHRAMAKREIQALMAFFRVYDIDCMLRPHTFEKTSLYRFLEDGATGLMIPHVSTVEKAELLVDAVKFPPIGDRGLDAAGFDSDFQRYDADEYVAWANRETFLVVQIETPQAVENVDSIAAVEGVDCLFLGPGDLGLRYRQMGDSDGSMLEAAYEKVAEAAKKHGKQWSAPALSKDDLHARLDQGIGLVARGGEFEFVKSGLARSAAEFEGR